jgi:hypothetical protein
MFWSHNGSPDNITATVVHALEVGNAKSFFRYPVPAGSREIDVDTAVLKRLHER